MKLARLASGIGLWMSFTACAELPPPQAPAPPPNTSGGAAKTAAAEEQAAQPESRAAAPAPAAARDGLDMSKAQRARDEADFSTLEAAERALNQAKADLDRLALAQPAKVIGNDATADRPVEKKAEKKESKPGAAPSPAGAAAASKPSALCEDACRAFSSLSRAASAVCRLDGSSGTHCSHARQVLADAERRIASCSCTPASD